MRPAWSPDESMIAFVWTDKYGGKAAVHVVNADGSGERQVARIPWVTSGLDWSPDGSTVIVGRGFLSGHDATEIVAATADGRELTPVAPRALHAYSPDASP
jgi:dipeptidyl aminopeptidase/acylaminoacyl peptidase